MSRKIEGGREGGSGLTECVTNQLRGRRSVKLLPAIQAMIVVGGGESEEGRPTQEGRPAGGRSSHGEEELKIKTPADAAKISNMPPSFTLDWLTNLVPPPPRYGPAGRGRGILHIQEQRSR